MGFCNHPWKGQGSNSKLTISTKWAIQLQALCLCTGFGLYRSRIPVPSNMAWIHFFHSPLLPKKGALSAWSFLTLIWNKGERILISKLGQSQSSNQAQILDAVKRPSQAPEMVL